MFYRKIGSEPCDSSTFRWCRENFTHDLVITEGDRKIIPDEKLGKVFLDKQDSLNEWITFLTNISSQFDTIFVLINNRFSGYAINDAITLSKFLSLEGVDVRGFEKSDKYLKRQMSLSEFLQ